MSTATEYKPGDDLAASELTAGDVVLDARYNDERFLRILFVYAVSGTIFAGEDVRQAEGITEVRLLDVATGNLEILDEAYNGCWTIRQFRFCGKARDMNQAYYVGKPVRWAIIAKDITELHRKADKLSALLLEETPPAPSYHKTQHSILLD